MQGPMPEVFDQVGAVERPACVEPAGAWADVPGVGAGGGVTSIQRAGHRPVADDSRHATVAGRVKLAVPVFGREPDLEVDRWLGRGGDTTERRKLDRLVGARWGERSSGQRLGQRDRRLREH